MQNAHWDGCNYKCGIFNPGREKGTVRFPKESGLTIFDMGFFELSIMGGGDMRAPIIILFLLLR